MNFLDSYRTWRKVRQELRDKVDCRRGFLCAVSQRLFFDMPPIISEVEIRQGSPAFHRGYEYGLTCPLAVGDLPPDDKEEEAPTPKDDGRRTAARFSLALALVAVFVLWAVRP